MAAEMQAGSRRMNFYGDGIAYLRDLPVRGRFIVIEGPDGSGRSTQVEALTSRLESDGHAVLNTGLKRSELVAKGILRAKQSTPLGNKTMTLMYAADLADQIEHKIIPALEAGTIVVADRYIFTLMARSAVRGLGRKWLSSLFGFALVPDMVFYLDVTPSELFYRAFQKYSALDYYESGADMGVSGDLYESFIIYQKRIATQFRQMEKSYSMIRIDGNKTIEEVGAELQEKVGTFLGAL